MKRIFLMILAACLFFSGISVQAAFETEAAVCREILQAQWEKESVSDLQAYIDRLAETPGDGREWYLYALAVSDPSLDFSEYAQKLREYLLQKNPQNPVSRQKYALILYACGFDSDFIEDVKQNTVGTMGVMSVIFGLHLANNGLVPENMTANTIVDMLLSLRLDKGGYAVSGTLPNPDATAMAIQALAPYYGIRTDVKDAVDADLMLLGEMQTENGGFVAYGVENPESTAQVLLALTCLGLDSDTDLRFIKNGNTVTDAILRFQLENGTFSHEKNGSTDEKANMQVLLAMTAKEKKFNPYLLSPQTLSEKAPQSLNWKLFLIIGIVISALLICLILFLCKKKLVKQYLPILILAAAAICTVLFLDIQTTDSYYGNTPLKENIIGEVTLSIRCDVVMGTNAPASLPENGMILPPTVFPIAEGDSVYTILTEAARQYEIHMESGGSGELAYIEGIAYLYELQFGELSGWIYSVNGEYASSGCGRYLLSPGDVIVWEYSLDLK